MHYFNREYKNNITGSEGNIKIYRVCETSKWGNYFFIIMVSRALGQYLHTRSTIFLLYGVYRLTDVLEN